MHRVAAKFVPCLMTNDQQAHCVQVCRDLLDHSENNKEFLSMIITGDESWFMVMTWKQRSNLRSGRVKHPPDPKKLAKFDPKSRCCS